MAIYHCSIKIISRSSGRSAVAAAAYRSGERLYNDETGEVFDFTRKSGVIMNEIMLPVGAPAAFKNRELLWQQVQKIEKRSDARLAREIEVALPKELPRNQQIDCVHKFIYRNFVTKGMIADWALHDKGDGNPHAHIMLTVRGFDDKGNWNTKSRSVYANARDASGRAVYDPDLPAYDPTEKKDETGHRPSEQYRIPQLNADGTQKVRIRKGKGTERLWERINIPANDWNDRANAECWRRSWAEVCNIYLKPEDQIDHRSFARQGITDQQPTIHEGVPARKIEQAGGTAQRCEQNRQIRTGNLKLRQLQDELLDMLQDVVERIKEAADGVRSKLDKAYEQITRDRETIGGTGEYGIRSAVSSAGVGDCSEIVEIPGGREYAASRRKREAEQRERSIGGIIEELKRRNGITGKNARENALIESALVEHIGLVERKRAEEEQLVERSYKGEKRSR